MKKFFTIYSLSRCPWCKRAVALLEEKNIPFVLVTTDNNLEFLEKICTETKRDEVPICVFHSDLNDYKVIGDFLDLERFINSLEFSLE